MISLVLSRSDSICFFNIAPQKVAYLLRFDFESLAWYCHFLDHLFEQGVDLSAFAEKAHLLRLSFANVALHPLLPLCCHTSPLREVTVPIQCRSITSAEVSINLARCGMTGLSRTLGRIEFRRPIDSTTTHLLMCIPSSCTSAHMRQIKHVFY